jgi:hypothetical protein
LFSVDFSLSAVTTALSRAVRTAVRTRWFWFAREPRA